MVNALLSKLTKSFTIYVCSFQVSGFREETSEDCLTNYFENKFRSDGGEIIRNLVDHEQCEAVIVFKDKTGSSLHPNMLRILVCITRYRI